MLLVWFLVWCHCCCFFLAVVLIVPSQKAFHNILGFDVCCVLMFSLLLFVLRRRRSAFASVVCLRFFGCTVILSPVLSFSLALHLSLFKCPVIFVFYRDAQRAQFFFSRWLLQWNVSANMYVCSYVWSFSFSISIYSLSLFTKLHDANNEIQNFTLCVYGVWVSLCVCVTPHTRCTNGKPHMYVVNSAGLPFCPIDEL